MIGSDVTDVPATGYKSISLVKHTLVEDHERIERVLSESVSFWERGFPNCCEDCQEMLKQAIA